MSWERGEFIVEADCGSDETIIKERIVRCGDCKYYHTKKYNNINCEWFMFDVEPYGFCAWGEPNDDMVAFGLGGLCAMIANKIIRYRKDVKRWQTRSQKRRKRRNCKKR